MTESLTIRLPGDGWTLIIDADFEPGDPGVHTLRNGDPGYPPTGDSLEVTSVMLTRPDELGVDLTEILADLGLLECERFIERVSEAVYAELERRDAQDEEARDAAREDVL